MDNFTQDIKDLEVTTVERARQAIENKENATFFIGRKTCPYCRKFATTLASVVAETQAYISRHSLTYKNEAGIKISNFKVYYKLTKQ